MIELNKLKTQFSENNNQQKKTHSGKQNQKNKQITLNIRKETDTEKI